MPLTSACISGTSLNPFLVFSGSVMTTYIYEHQWVYYIAPLIGIIIAGVFHKGDIIQLVIVNNLKGSSSDKTDINIGKSSTVRKNPIDQSEI